MAGVVDGSAVREGFEVRVDQVKGFVVGSSRWGGGIWVQGAGRLNAQTIEATKVCGSLLIAGRAATALSKVMCNCVASALPVGCGRVKAEGCGVVKPSHHGHVPPLS